MQRADRIILQKMLHYCDDIASILLRIDGSFSRFEADTLYQYACNMCLMQIGELVGRLSKELIEQTPELPWKYARAMRNLYAHDYESAQLELVFVTLTEDIPAFRNQIQQLLEHDTV